MINLEEAEIEQTENVIYASIPYDENFPLLWKDMSLYDEEALLRGKRHHIIDVLVADSGESITVILAK